MKKQMIKKAYACNKKHPHFQVIDVERKIKFYTETGFRIDAQVNIDKVIMKSLAIIRNIKNWAESGKHERISIK